MSIFTWFGRIFRGLFGKEGFLKKKIIPFVIDAVNNVKNFDTTNPEFADLLTKLIPGSADDELIAKARIALRIAIEKAALFQSCLQVENEDERIKCIIEQIQSIVDADVRALKWAEIAAHATKYLANDDRLDINEIASLIKMTYNGIEEDN